MRRSYKILLAAACSFVIGISFPLLAIQIFYREYASLWYPLTLIIGISMIIVTIGGFVSLVIGGIIFFRERKKSMPKQTNKPSITYQKIYAILCPIFIWSSIAWTGTFLILKTIGVDSPLAQILALVCGGIISWIVYKRLGGSLLKIVENSNAILYHRKQFRKAIDWDEPLLKEDPKNYNLLHRIGYGYTMLNEYENAIKYYQGALMINRNDPVLLVNLSSSYIGYGDYENAVKFANEALKIKKDFDVALYVKAAAKSLQKNKAEAISLLKEAIRQDPVKYKKLASEEPDFDYIKNDEEFKKLME